MPFVLLLKTGMSPNVLSFDAQIRDAMELKIQQKRTDLLNRFSLLREPKIHT